MTIILLLAISFAASFVGTLARSGGLNGMPSLLLIGPPIHQVIGSVKFPNMFSSFSSFYILLKKKQQKLKDALQLIPFALFGGLCCGLLANSFSGKAMNLLAICLLTVALIMNFIKKPQPSDETDWHLPKKVYPSLFVISVYDGMFGPGQATMLMYTFLRNGATYLQSLAITRFQTFISCTAAFITYSWPVKRIAIYYTFGSLIGSRLALRVAQKISTGQLRFILHSVTIALSIQLVIRVAFP
ncbi:sulfite exporter TauE/SafE family protein [Peribacillus frigoritolerans]|uniref:sulfite exporter TauE/SafE family protein n=1 Tax=Peribacillus frigoritolerans TaxID=450367 RepID=UPI00300A5D41